MSFVSRAFTAQQERRRRRLLVGPLIVQAQQHEADRAVQHQRYIACDADDGVEPVGQRGETPQAATSARPPGGGPAQPCASQQRALVQLQRLHPTATHLACLTGVSDAQWTSQRGKGTSPAAIPLHRSRWRKPLPWAVLPPVPQSNGKAVNTACSNQPLTGSHANGQPHPSGHGVNGISNGGAHSRFSGAGSFTPGGMARELRFGDLEPWELELLGDSQSLRTVDPSALHTPPGGALSIAPAAAPSSVAPPPQPTPGVLGGSRPADPSLTSIVRTLAHREWERCIKELSEMLGAALAAWPRLNRGDVQLRALATREAQLQRAVMTALTQSQHAEDSAECLAGRRRRFRERLSLLASSDRARAAAALQKRGWSGAGVAKAELQQWPVGRLRALMEEVQPGLGREPAHAAVPGNAEPAGPEAAPVAAAPGLDAMGSAGVIETMARDAWSRLVKCAALEEARRLRSSAAAEAGAGGGGDNCGGGGAGSSSSHSAGDGAGETADRPDYIRVLRSAVLGLVLLEGCTGAEAGPVGLLGPPDPLACAMLAPLGDALRVQALCISQITPDAQPRSVPYISAALLYDAIAYGGALSGNASEGAGDATRPSHRHVEHLLSAMPELPDLLLAEAQLARAAAAGMREAFEAAATEARAMLDELHAVQRRAGEARANGERERERQQGQAVPQWDGGTRAAGACGSGGGGGSGAAADWAGAAPAQAEAAEASESDDSDWFLSDEEGDDVAGMWQAEACDEVESSPGGDLTYDCLYVPAAEWEYWRPAGSHAAATGVHRDHLVFSLSTLGLLDVEYDSTAVRRLRRALRAAQREQFKCFISGGDAADGDGAGGGGGGRTTYVLDMQGVKCMAMEAEDLCARRRRGYAEGHSDWRRQWGTGWEALLLRLEERPLRAASVREVVTLLRPELLDAHPDTWGRLLQELEAGEAKLERAAVAGGDGAAARPGRDPEEARREVEHLREVARMALYGLAALVAVDLTPESLRLAFCTVAGYNYFHRDRDITHALAIGSAVDLFLFLSTVPCPLLVEPERGWTNFGDTASPLLNVTMRLPRADSRRQSCMACLLNHSLSRYDLFPDLSGKLMVWMRGYKLARACHVAAAERRRGGGGAGGEGGFGGAAAGRRSSRGSSGGDGGGEEREAPKPAPAEAEADTEAEEEADRLKLKLRYTTIHIAALTLAIAPGCSSESGSSSDGEQVAQEARKAGAGEEGLDDKERREGAAQVPGLEAGSVIDLSCEGRNAQHEEQEVLHPAKGGATARPGASSSNRPGWEDGVPCLGASEASRDILEALYKLVNCCRWRSRGSAMLEAAAHKPPPATPSSLTLAGQEAMSLALLFLYCTRPPWQDSGEMQWLVFEPFASEELMRSVCRLPAHQEVQLFPPPRGEQAVVQLRGVQAAALPNRHFPKYESAYAWSAIDNISMGITVTATSRWPDHWRTMEAALIKKRLGVLFLYADGMEGAQRALLLAVKAADQVSRKYGTTLYACCVSLFGPKPEAAGGDSPEAETSSRQGRRRDRSGGSAGGDDGAANAAQMRLFPAEVLRDLTFLAESMAELSQLRERDLAAGKTPLEDGPGWLMAEGYLDAVMQEVFGADQPLREGMRIELMLYEAERGRPDRPHAPFGGPEAERRRKLQKAMFQ